jgi:hypothetical protein
MLHSINFMRTPLITILLLASGLHLAAMPFTITQLASTGGTGRFLSMDLDSSGNPSVTFVNNNLDLIYGVKSGGGWTFQTVAQNAGFNSLAFTPGGTATIFYQDVNPQNAPLQNLDAIQQAGSSWTTPTVIHTGFTTGEEVAHDIGPDNAAYAIFWTSTQPQSRLASGPNSTNWSLTNGPSVVEPQQAIVVGSDSVARILTADGGTSHLLYGVRQSNGTISFQDLSSLMGNKLVGEEKSITIDQNGDVHISFLDSNSALWYGRLHQGVWSFESVGGASRYDRIQVGPDGTPYIVYFDATDNALSLATKTGSGWNSQVIDPLPSLFPPSGEGLTFDSFQVDQSGRLSILYWNSETRTVDFATAAPVPEPAAIILTAIGLCAILGTRLRRLP